MIREGGYEVLHCECVNWIKEWFEENGKGCNAIIGISGGKDSTIAAYLCAEALGKDRVIGLLMPNGIQKDYDDAILACESIGIKYKTIDIDVLYLEFLKNLNSSGITPTDQTIQNLPPRIRMSLLYAVAQSMNGRVCNTCNWSERAIGWETLWGDSVGDFSPFGNLTVAEVIGIGDTCNLPKHLIHKAPSDGLCGMTDEEKLGFTYQELNDYFDDWDNDPKTLSLEKKTMIQNRIENSRFKRQMCHIPTFHASNSFIVKYEIF